MSEKPVVRLLPELGRFRLDGAADGQLVELYARERDDDAFAELVRRHGSMVLAVCRRILRNSADADDAFQATFLVLARRAGSIHPAGAVGAWLHGVAFRTAREAVRRAARRRAKESRVVPRDDVAEVPPDDFRPILDAELDRLPARYSQVLILCDMEGRTRRDVAAMVAVPEGTIASRLARAREMLAGRLRRRGIGLTAGAIAMAIATDVQGSPSPALVAETTRQATAFGAGQAVTPSVLELAQAVLGSFTLRFKLAIALIVVAVLGAAGWAVELASKPPIEPPVVNPNIAPDPVAKIDPPQPLDAVALARKQLIGPWRVEGGAKNGAPLTPWDKQGVGIEFTPTGILNLQRFQIRDLRSFTWSIDSASGGMTLMLTPPGGKPESRVKMSFDVKDDSLTLSWEESRGVSRGTPGSNRFTFTRLASPAVAPVPTVAASPQNKVASGLVGSWTWDEDLNKRLGDTAEANRTVRLTFASDPAIASQVSETYRELFAGKRIYLAGRMTFDRSKGISASHPFLLIEHLGNPMLVYFVPRNGDDWACEEAATVMFAAGTKPDNDLLFLTAFEGAKALPSGGFRRSK